MNTIRLANFSDAKSILDIYAPYILNTAFTFETDLPSIKDFAQRIISCQQSWPWLVFEVDGFIAGYAYAAKHRERSAYQWCVESSVYVHDNFQRRGIANGLYKALFAVLQYQGCRNVYAGITLPNDASVAFHTRLGFSWLADYKNIGYKLNQWNTVSWWQLQLNEYSNEPAEPIKLADVANDFLKKIFNENQKS